MSFLIEVLLDLINILLFRETPRQRETRYLMYLIFMVFIVLMAIIAVVAYQLKDR